MLSTHWLVQNPHLWVPPALLAVFLAGVLAYKLFGKAPPEAPEGREAEERLERPAPPERIEAAPEAAAPEAAESEAVATEAAPSIEQAPEAPPIPEIPRAPRVVPPPEVPEAPGTIAAGLAKTRKGWLGKLSGIFSRNAVDEELYDELEEVLLGSDVGPKTALALMEKVRARVKQEKIKNPGALRGLLKSELLAVLAKAPPAAPIPDAPRPWVVMVNGVNGVGKTTTIGKLARLLRDQGYKVLLGAADTFRAAATEQLEIWAGRTGCEIVKGRPDSDPGAVAFDAVKAGAARGADVVLIDTAGRLHTQQALMDELAKVKRVIGKAMEGAPHETWVVVDGNTGQNAVNQVKQFNDALALSGVIVTKLDGTAKGGALFAVVEEFGLPVRYAGVGERLGDLIPFDAEAFVEALLEEPQA